MWKNKILHSDNTNKSTEKLACNERVHLEQPRSWTQMGSMWQSIFVNEVSFNEEKSILIAHLLMKPSLVSECFLGIKARGFICLTLAE